MKKFITHSILFATMLTPMARADDPTPTPAHVEVHRTLTTAGGAGGGGGGETINIVGDGNPMQRMVFVNASQKLEKGTYLGVTTSSVPASLRAQMTLQKGFGLVVETIEKDSPAQKAGLEKYDILQKLNDQLLVNQQQLQVLVRSMKPGDSVAITLIRKGQPLTVNATLIEKDVPELSEADVFTPNGGVFTTGIAPEIMKWEGSADPLKMLRSLNINTNEVSSVISTDNDQTLELTSKDGGKKLIVKDKDDKVLFDGPIDTPEQRAKLPEGVEAKLDKLEGKLHKITIRAKVNATHAPEAGKPDGGKD